MRKYKLLMISFCQVIFISGCELKSNLDSKLKIETENVQENKTDANGITDREKKASLMIEKWIQEHFMNLSPELKRYWWFYSQLNKECNEEGLLRRDNSKAKIEWTSDYQVKNVEMQYGEENPELEEYVKNYMIEYIKTNGLSEHLKKQLKAYDNCILLVAYWHLYIWKRKDARILELKELEK